MESLGKHIQALETKHEQFTELIMGDGVTGSSMDLSGNRFLFAILSMLVHATGVA